MSGSGFDESPDGELFAEVGEWAEEKLTLLSKYIEISGGARKRFLRTGAAYIDLYCGPALLKVRDTNRFIAGSPLAALRATERSGFPFTEYIIGDENRAFTAAAANRLQRNGARVRALIGRSEETARLAVQSVDPRGLHFALLDPFSLELPFSVIQELAVLKRIDIMIHLSTGDLQRNLWNVYLEPENVTLDRFAPGWRNSVDVEQRQTRIREQVVNHWFGLLKDLGLGPDLKMHAVRNSTRSTMYWLVFASRHELAKRFWGIAMNYLAQTRLV